MKIKILFLFCVFLHLTFSGFSQSSLIEKFVKKIPEIEKKIQQIQNEWNVPAIGIAIVTDTSEILVTSYGINDINNKNNKADKNTIFAIASNTKAFTATALAILVDENRLSWEDKVTKYLKDFRLYNHYVTFEMTVRDLLCHRSGLETFSGDLLWYASNYTRKDVIHRARYLKPKYSFRTNFGYSNIMYLAAGEIIPEITDTSWDIFLNERIFKPLGMTRTFTSVNQISNLSNVALPHTEHNGKLITIPYLNWDNIGPAGSILSTPADMAKWLQLQLGRGTFKNKKIFSKESSWEMWSINTIEKISEKSTSIWPSTHFKGYALGWEVFDYNGRKIISHNGGYDGMISNTTIIPEENFAFIILTNSNTIVYLPLTYYILDEFLETKSPIKDWNSFFLDYIKRKKQNELDERKKWENQRVKNTKPSLNLKDYCGIYNSELYGNAKIELTNDNKLKLTLLPSPKFNAILNHWHYDTFEIKFDEFPSLPSGTVTFTLDKYARVNRMIIDVPNPDFDFTELDFIKIDENKN